ncbi:MAG: motility associated factor glycosyltransferase family protein [Bacillota bacterium]
MHRDSEANLKLNPVAVNSQRDKLTAPPGKQALPPERDFLLELENLWRNLPYLTGSYSVDSSRNLLRGKPAILVTSGPSLNKNIDLLREIQKRAIVISCGSALAPMYKRGIVPHFEVVSDPYPLMYEKVKLVYQPETCFLMSLTAHYRISQIAGLPKMYCLVDFADEVLADLRKCTQINTVLPVMASVAATAFSFALHLGADPVIFVGQDMCFSGEQSHVDNMDKAVNTCTLEAVDGRVVQTTPLLKEVFEYFGNLVPRIKERKIINATEGGAGIPGAEHITLAETAARYLSGDLVLPHLPPYQGDLLKLKNGLEEIDSKFRAINRRITDFHQKITRSTKTAGVKDLSGEDILDRFNEIKRAPGYQYLAAYLDNIRRRVLTSLEPERKFDLFGVTAKCFQEQLSRIEETLSILNSFT